MLLWNRSKPNSMLRDSSSNFMPKLYITNRNTWRAEICTAGNKSPTPPTTSQSHLQPASTNNQKYVVDLEEAIALELFLYQHSLHN
jgi:hypothetical protein